jgi:hypothetical protein
MFSENDLIQIRQHGITQESAERQWNIVNQKKMNVTVVKPALKQDGLFVFNQQEVEDMITDYHKQIAKEKIIKFVPASGAATRMFKDLFLARDWLATNGKVDDLPDTALFFFDNIRKFAFFDALKTRLKEDGTDIDTLLSEKNYLPVLSCLLTEKGLNYGKLPKGLLLFHHYTLYTCTPMKEPTYTIYAQYVRTALEEHLAEVVGYVRGEDNTAHLHFTVSPEHVNLFDLHCKEVIPLYEEQFRTNYHIDFSTQHCSTDTIAFTTDNKPFRDREGNLVFRPGGHGSLIENLNHLDADIVLIKNIDNVTLDRYKTDTIIYKSLLISLLLHARKQIFDCLNMFDTRLASLEEIQKVESFLENMFFIHFEKEYYDLPLSERQMYLYRTLDRPVRVCGMVKRENEPGGGPFWVKDADGKLSLQIVETSEMNLSNAQQQEILERSAFFNPVDLVCSIKNHRGIPFNLLDYIDHSRYFISEKSYEGRTLKAIENPGLWNGAMSRWLTVFVAVPLTTFTPVKTINDLLQKGHTDTERY